MYESTGAVPARSSGGGDAHERRRWSCKLLQADAGAHRELCAVCGEHAATGAGADERAERAVGRK